MNWRCILRKHDWHRVASKLRREVVDDAYNDCGYRPEPITVFYGSEELEQKVCLRCGIKVDEIACERENVIAQLDEYRWREQLAKEMWEG